MRWSSLSSRIPVCRLIFALILTMVLIPALGFGESSLDYKIKAGFIYRFILFSEWPASAFTKNPDTFTIGIVGDNPFEDFLNQVINQQVDGRKLVISYLSAQPSQEKLSACQVLFIPSSLAGQEKQILKKVKGFPVLTISDMEGFLEKGGMISFFSRRNKIRFSVHRTHADRVGINFRGQMLKMAARVLEGN